MDAQTEGKQAQASAASDWPSPGRAWYALFILTIGLMIATVDRGILTLLVAPIRSHLGISDTQFSVLHGWAFVSVYAILGLPIARLADRSSRRLIIGVGMFFWSVSTALCGFANSFAQFFAARAGVGAGESAYAPAVYSILQDSFPPAKLPRVFAIMAIGFAYGTSFGVILGATLVLLATNLAESAHPLFEAVFGALAPWQVVLILVAIPGVLLAFTMATVQEPRRRGLLPGATKTTLPVGQVIDYFAEQGRTYGPMFASMGIKAMLGFGSGVWIPEMFRRTHQWAPAETALWIGGLGLIVAPLGLLTGSWLAERYAKRGKDDANLRVLQIATLLVLPFSVAFPLAPTPELSLGLWAMNLYCAMIGVGPANAAVQMITPNQMRGQIRAAYQFVFNVVGFGAGPFLVALFTDYVFHDDGALRYSLAAVAAIIGPVAVLLNWIGMKPYAACVVRSRAWT